MIFSPNLYPNSITSIILPVAKLYQTQLLLILFYPYWGKYIQLLWKLRILPPERVVRMIKNYWYSNGERKSKSYKYYTCKNINSKDSNCKSLSISYEKLNSLLEQKFSGHNFFDQKYSDKYLYKIVSELTSGKIDFSEFKSEFQKLVFYLDNSQKVIKKIFVNKDSKEIILSSS